MYCPKCGIENLVDQRFCRGCGHGLVGHRIALEKNFEDIAERIKSGSTALGICAVGLIMISLMGLGVWISQNDAGVFFTLIPVLAFVIPATILGLIRLTRAYRDLSSANPKKPKPVEQLSTAAVHLDESPTTDPLAPSFAATPSVTEHTTVNLESHRTPVVKER